jgi:hypothetical protein
METDRLDRDYAVMDVDDVHDDSSLETLQCPHCGARIKLNINNLEANQACDNCGGVLNIGNVYDIDTELIESATGPVISVTGRKIRGGMASLRTRDKRSYLDEQSKRNAAVLDDSETREGLLNRLNEERMQAFLHPVMCFIEIYQRILMHQVDHLIKVHKLSPLLRKYTGQIWLRYLQQLRMYSLIPQYLTSKEQN